MGFLSFDNRGREQIEVSLDLPVGCIMPCGLPAANIPAGWLECSGAPVDINLFPELHALLLAAGSPYGGGATPLIPDLRGRAPVGKGTHVDVDTLGKSDGMAVGLRTPRHLHSIPGHAHSVGNHNHPYGAHQHASPNHTHVGELHQHGMPTHGHTVSGNTGGTANGQAEVDFGTPGVNRICFNAHAHGAGSIGGTQTDPGNVLQAGNGSTTGTVANAFGGLTNVSAATTTGNSSDAVGSNGSSNSSTDPVSYLTARFIIKAVA